VYISNRRGHWPSSMSAAAIHRNVLMCLYRFYSLQTAVDMAGLTYVLFLLG